MAHHHHSGSASIINADVERQIRSNEAVALHKKQHQKDVKLFKRLDIDGRLKAIQDSYGQRVEAAARDYAITANDVVMGQVIKMPVLNLEDAARENLNPVAPKVRTTKGLFNFLRSAAAY